MASEKDEALIPCGKCGRHHRAQEAACPHCGATAGRSASRRRAFLLAAVAAGAAAAAVGVFWKEIRGFFQPKGKPPDDQINTTSRCMAAYAGSSPDYTRNGAPVLRKPRRFWVSSEMDPAAIGTGNLPRVLDGVPSTLSLEFGSEIEVRAQSVLNLLLQNNLCHCRNAAFPLTPVPLVRIILPHYSARIRIPHAP